MYGERESRRLCEETVGWHATLVLAGGGYVSEDDLCANYADIVWVSPSGSLTWTCAGHVPDPGDDELKPVETFQTSRWETIYYTHVHRFTGLQPVALMGCTDDVLTRALGVAAILAEYDRLPKSFEVRGGFMGTSEDEERLRAAGEQTGFPYIPESLRESFGGARTIMEVFEEPQKKP